VRMKAQISEELKFILIVIHLSFIGKMN